MSESKCLCVDKLIVFYTIKNEMPFLPLLQLYVEIFAEGTQSRCTSVLLQQPIVLVPKHITFLTQ
jgi:hypothetical protein